MIILAHRGWWLDPAEKNTAQAFARALAAGFGIETDIRDCDGMVVVAHDPPRGKRHMALDDLLKLYDEAGQPGALALNVKADGLQDQVFRALDQRGITNAFVFDMAVPDALGYLSIGVCTFTRQSEVEPVPAFLERASGVWLDCFQRDWITKQVIESHRKEGRLVALVSPELHRRSKEAAWRQWLDCPLDPSLMICTDFPDRAREYFGGAA